MERWPTARPSTGATHAPASCATRQTRRYFRTAGKTAMPHDLSRTNAPHPARSAIPSPGVKKSVLSLHQGSGGGYRSATSTCGPPKEEFREGADPVPHRQHVLGFSGGYLARHGAWLSSRGRHAGSPAAALEDHRGEGDRRSPHHAGRLSERAHRDGGHRAGGPRAASDVRRKLKLVAALAVAAGALLGCDQGTPTLSSGGKGPAPQVVWKYPSAANGGEAMNVPTLTSIRVQFDRFLAPESAVRQAICVAAATTTAQDQCIGGLVPEYDPVDRVAVWKGASLLPNQRYNVRLLLPTSPDDTTTGIRAFDGVPLDKEYTFAFT